MKILYVGMKYDYGIVERGLSFEHYNFFDSLLHMGHEIYYFDFKTIMNKYGQREMNQRLLAAVRECHPDLLFTILFKDEIEPATLLNISQSGKTITLNWFCDDQWRFESFSRHYAPCFNWVVTTSQRALTKYRTMGYSNVIKSQWACNHFLYRKMDLPLVHNVSFVGQIYGLRSMIVAELQQAGMDIKAWGLGWPLGRLDQSEMIQVFNQSRINLNMANASVERFALLRRAMRKLSRKIVPLRKYELYAESLLESLPGKSTDSSLSQIKGRTFEVPGCGGFLLTEEVENLEEYYQPGVEIAIYRDQNDLRNKVKYYLDHEIERAAIAMAGYERTIRDHTYQRRFENIFRRMGLEEKSVSGEERWIEIE
jgi:spore maturation protein CgeB